MKGILNKTLVLALLISATGMNAGIGATVADKATQYAQASGSLLKASGRFCLNHSEPFVAFVKSHPYALGISAAALLGYEAGMRYFGYAQYTPSHAAFVAGKKTVAAAKVVGKHVKDNKGKYLLGTAAVAGAVYAHQTGLDSKVVALAKPYVVKAYGKTSDYIAPKLTAVSNFVTSNSSKAVAKVTEVAVNHPTATKVFAGTLGAAATYGAVKGVQKFRSVKSDSSAPVVEVASVVVSAPVVEVASVVVSAPVVATKSVKTAGRLDSHIATVKAVFNEKGVVRVPTLALNCEGLLNETDLTDLNSLVTRFNKEQSRTAIKAKGDIGRAIIALLERANS